MEQTLHVVVAVAEQVSLLVGALLLGLDSLVGVHRAQLWLLKAKARLERWMGPYRKDWLMGTSTEPVDLEKERAGRLLNLVPHQTISSIIVFTILAFYAFGTYVSELLIRVHGYIGQLGPYRHFLHPFVGILEAVVLIYVFLFGWAFFNFIFTILFVLGVAVIATPLYIFLMLAIATMRYFSAGKIERKMAWLGFSLLVVAFILHFVS